MVLIIMRNKLYIDYFHWIMIFICNNIILSIVDINENEKVKLELIHLIAEWKIRFIVFMDEIKWNEVIHQYCIKYIYWAMKA